MSLESTLAAAEQLYETLTTADVVDNTFGATWRMRDLVRDLDREVRGRRPLSADLRERVERLVENLDINRDLFMIPEKHLIRDLFAHHAKLKQALAP